MLLHKDTPYKVLQYLIKLSNDKALPICYKNENYIRYLVDRKAIAIIGKQFSITRKFEESLLKQIESTFMQCNSFIEKYDLAYLENHYSIEEVEALIKIESEKQKIIEQE